MERRGRFFIVICSVFVASLMALPAWADKDVANKEIEEQIKALEAEVSKIEPLKEQIERLKYQQLELKKEATAAAAALPSFSYRPGRGLTIAAADQSWQLQTSYRLNIHIHNHPDGRPRFLSNAARSDGGTTVNTTGMTEFELFPRRNRIYFNYCWANCFYEINYSIDGETSVRQASVRDNEITFHFEQLNPYFPYFSIGLRRGAGATHIARSSSSDAKLEHHIVFGGFDWGGDGSHAGLGLGWDRVALGWGDASLFLNLPTSKQGTHQEFVDNDEKGIMMFVGTRPFSQIKNKWIQGFEVGFGYQGQSTKNGDTEIRVRTNERRGRVDLFRLGTTGTSGNVGDGYGQLFVPGVRWRIGPYMMRAVWLKTDFEGRNDGMRGVKGKGWNISNQIFVWSPKGLLTGSPTTPGSVLVGFDFERGDMECGIGCDAAPFAGDFHRNTVLNRELGIWYWILPSFRVGAWWHWYKAANTPVVTQVAVGCKGDIRAANTGKVAGRECDWHSWNLGIQAHW